MNFTRFRYDIGEKVYTFWWDNDEKGWTGRGKITRRKFIIRYLTTNKDIAYLHKQYEWINKTKDGKITLLFLSENHIFKSMEDAEDGMKEHVEKIKKIIGTSMLDKDKPSEEKTKEKTT